MCNRSLRGGALFLRPIAGRVLSEFAGEARNLSATTPGGSKGATPPWRAGGWKGGCHAAAPTSPSERPRSGTEQTRFDAASVTIRESGFLLAFRWPFFVGNSTWVAFGGTRGPLRGGPLDSGAPGASPLDPQKPARQRHAPARIAVAKRQPGPKVPGRQNARGGEDAWLESLGPRVKTRGWNRRG